MGTVIDQLDVTRAGWRDRHSALQLAVTTAKTCLQRAGTAPDELDLMINTGIYRDRNLGEPALAALIQKDIGANPEDPHGGGHGTFSFDIANGTCGVLSAVQIVDGFLRSHTVKHALIVASDANPGHRMSEHFPFSPVGAALLCGWHDNDDGFGRVHWVNHCDHGDGFSATVGLEDGRNVLRVNYAAAADRMFAAAAAQAALSCLQESSLTPSEVDLIVAAPARRDYRAALAALLAVALERIVVAEDPAVHTASLVAALNRAADHVEPGSRILLIAAGAGVTAGAALYHQPTR